MPDTLMYKIGLDEVQEAVVSSHFMHKLGNDPALAMYGAADIAAKSLWIESATLFDVLVPKLMAASRAFCRERADEARRRARENFRDFGLPRPGAVGPAHRIAELMFDRQFSRDSRKHYSKQTMAAEVAARIDAAQPIQMVIPALPFKISSPLKSRGASPDLAEVNFLLDLYEIAAAVDILYRDARPDSAGPLATFAVVSDGSRFSALTGEPPRVIADYRARLGRWIERLGIGDHVRLYDYSELLRRNLPVIAQHEKARIAKSSALEYSETMWSIFDQNSVATSLRLAATVEPDPEYANPEGRFVSLLKSLIYTINYKSLQEIKFANPDGYELLYRELTSHLFEPFVAVPPDEHRRALHALGKDENWPLSDETKERLRRLMLREAWEATILYMAEIKSDRELAEEPILTCLPGHLRWTIHAKRGQLAITVPTALGMTVQAWAGTAVFKRTGRNAVKLSVLPVLALEGAGAVPVRVRDPADELGLGDQPLFYIHPDVDACGIDALLRKLDTSFVRKRIS